MRHFEKHTVGPHCNGCIDRLRDGHEYLRELYFYLKEKDEFKNLHVSWVHRDEASQNEAFANGDSKLKWPLSKHNKMPALAMDIFQINEKGQAIFDPIFCAKAYHRAFDDGFKKIRWGGHFKTLGDSGHFEFLTDEEIMKNLVKP